MQALAMGGYGGYVWAAFGFTLISMIGLLWQSWRAQQRRAGELAALRSSVRGGRPTSNAAERGPTRRLVAQKPEKTETAAALGAQNTISGPAGERYATSRPTTGS